MVENLKIVVIGSHVAKVLLQHNLPKTFEKVRFELVFVSPQLKNIQKREIGFDYENYLASVLSEVKIENALVVTPHPMNTGLRFNKAPVSSEHNKSGVLTLKGINSETYSSPIAALLYHAILELTNQVNTGASHEENCLTQISQAYFGLETRLMCDNCKSITHQSIKSHNDTILRLQRTIIKFPMNHHIVLTHGIKTYGAWMREVKYLMESCGFNVFISGYEKFSVTRLLSYYFKDAGKKTRASLVNDIKNIKVENPHAKVSVIAHSHGSLLICQALNQKEVSFDNLILVGSIAKRDMNWPVLIGEKLVSSVLNDASTNDIWSAMAHNWVRTAGGSGILGFEKEFDVVRTVFRKGAGHSSALIDKEHQQRLWLTYLEKGEVDWSILGDEDYCRNNESSLAVKLVRYLTVRNLSLFICLSVSVFIAFTLDF